MMVSTENFNMVALFSANRKLGHTPIFLVLSPNFTPRVRNLFEITVWSYNDSMSLEFEKKTKKTFLRDGLG